MPDWKHEEYLAEDNLDTGFKILTLKQDICISRQKKLYEEKVQNNLARIKRLHTQKKTTGNLVKCFSDTQNFKKCSS